MKAQVLHGVGDLRYEEVERPKIREGMALVKVMAAGICGSDIARVYTTGAHKMPLIPGHEFAGIVEEIHPHEGTEADEGSGLLGKRVGIFPLIPCMKCPQCLKKQYEMCRNYQYLGSRNDGGFAEFVEVPVWNLLELPDEVTFEQAAMLEPASVAMHAIRAMQVQKGESIAICGLGTIGLLAAMHLKGMGVEKVYAIGNKTAQKRMAERIGIAPEYFCDTKAEDPLRWLQTQTSGNWVDVFFECIGKNEIVDLSINAVAPGGRVMLVGNPASDMQLEKEVYWKILRKQLTLKGTWNSSYLGEEEDDWHRVLQAIADQRIHPEELITHRFSLEELPKGLEIMRDKTEDYVKIMIVNE